MLKTKEINKPVSLDDGIRICVTAGLEKGYKFDIWWKNLAPSMDLLRDYWDKLKTDPDQAWISYVPMYKKDVLEKQKFYVKVMADIAMKYDVTILCHEDTPDRCHRRLLAEECKKYQSNLELILE